ncbi:tRNA A-37 threonylcarbamoyl transferase component Bud32 [Streptomyces canus]|uniref:non-specific serine/threonine protein kinase n=1 Tax=Streptomyces canus TaxID=58343 RepID=A0AAW8FUT8_9ACTN|nr:serine/threonine-protein kinase [Streptomyces canus]MDQ0912746.1 tRNA A-37 threonylcarbamoyl transferase component Bud32 [Streptomyces canus]
MSSGETNGKGQDEAGRLLAGRYRVVAQLGRGGMGVVWRAVDEVLGREVAVKELRTYTDADGPELADLRLRMQREARAAARVRHPGVVAVHDVAEVDGRPLIVMELVDGPSLDAVLRKSGPLDPREAAGIGAKVMDALAAAHEAGVLHRDVKPGNILLDRSGRVLLTDFGIATMDDPGDGSATNLTRTGHLVGSLDYMAPERAQGADPGPASDVWGLGATLYAAVEGASPFHRTSTFSTLTAIVGEPLPESRRAGPLGPVLQRLLDKRPEARPGAGEARGLLQAVADGAGSDRPTTTLRGTAGSAGRAETAPDVPAAPVASAGLGPTDPTRPGSAAGSGSHGAEQAQGPGEHETAGTVAAQPTAPAAAVEPGTPGQGAAGQAGVPAPWWVTQDGAPGRTGLPGQGPGAFAPQAGGPGQPGPSEHGPGAFVAAPGQPASPAYGHGASALHDPLPPGPMTTAPRPRRKGRALLVAAAVTVVLAGAGTAVAMLNNSGDAEADARPSATATTATASTSARTDADRSSSPGPTDGNDKKTASAKGTSADDGGSKPTSRASASATANSSGGGTSGGDGSDGSSGGSGSGGSGSGDGGTTGDGGSSTPAPACTAIGGGKYNCTVWKTATSYTASGAEAGVLNAGTNYFYCQSNLGRRETSGEWTNVWWAKTDDDSGNTGVYVSDVYLKGGNNDEPVPGLPVC